MRTRWASRAPVATLLAALTLVVAATACSDPLAPEDAAGVYVRGPGGFTYAPNDAYYRVHADTILLLADGTGVRRTHIELPTMGPMPTITRNELPFRYSLDGRDVLVSYLCPGMCLAMSAPVRFELWGGVLIARDEPDATFERRSPVAPVGELY